MSRQLENISVIFLKRTNYYQIQLSQNLRISVGYRVKSKQGTQFRQWLEHKSKGYRSSGQPIVSNEALASLTLFVAASKPEEMDTVKKLVISVLNRNQ